MINSYYFIQYTIPLLLIQFKWGQIPAFIVLLTVALFSIKNVRDRASNVRNKIFLLFLFYVCLLAMSRFETISKISSSIDFFWFLVGFFCFSIILTKKSIDLNEARNAINIAFAIGLILGMTVVSNMVSLNILFEPKYANIRYVAGFDGPNEASAFYLAGYVYSLSQIVSKPQKKHIVWLLFFNAVASSIVIINTWSLAGILGWITFTIINLVDYGFKNRKSIIKWLGVTGLIAGIISYSIIYLYPLYSFIRRAQTDRFDMYITLIEFMREYNIIEILFGRGFYGYSQYGKTAHNEFINILLSGGIISISILFILFALVVSIAIKNEMFPEMYVLLAFFTQEATFNHIVRGRVSIILWIIVILTFCSSSKIENTFKLYWKDKRGVIDT